jgi:5-methylcytosine-specific restriction endonuclease McrA
MSDPTNPTRDLTAGRGIGYWLVMAYAGERNGVRCWKCICCKHRSEKLVAEQDLLDRKVDALFSHPWDSEECCRCQSGSVYGEWTVIGQATQHETGAGECSTLWKCRCVCGAERDIPESDLSELRTLSCGCRPDAEVRVELGRWHGRARKRLCHAGAAAKRRSRERGLDNRWTRDMEAALRRCQTACVLCGATDDLTTHHLRPLSCGHGLEPGNAVRLCRACNSSIADRDPGVLSPDQARKLETAAVRFKEFWESGCATPEA